MHILRYILVCIIFFYTSNTFAHERSLNSTDCHTDYVSGDHCHPEGNYQETIFLEPEQEEIELPSATNEEIKEYLKKDKTCREFIKNQWADGIFEICEEMLKVGDVYSQQEVKDILIRHTTCFEFTKFTEDYSQCDDMVTQGTYSSEELEKLSKGYKKCDSISAHLYADKELCLKNKKQRIQEEKQQAAEQEEKLKQAEQNRAQMFVIDKELSSKLDTINIYLKNLYTEQQERVEDLLINIQTSKKHISITSKKYAILDYIERYLQDVVFVK